MNSPFTIQLGAGQQVVLEDFTSGDYGIALVEAPPAATGFARTIGGDLARIDVDPLLDGVQLGSDDLGNVLTSPDVLAADQSDTLNDSAGNDLIQGLGGDDRLVGWRGGNDRLEGGAGHDHLQAGDGDDVLVGGSERDILMAGYGNDRLYADEELSVGAAVALGEGAASGLPGEWLDGRGGDDTLVGGAGTDVLLGGSGSDIILGGAGNDNIDGDLATDWVGRDWTATRSVSSGVYTTAYGQSNIFDPGAGGDDFIYAGGGDDWARGGRGDDWIDGGSGNDVLFGQEGHDALFGGAGNDKLFGDETTTPLAEQGDDFLDGGAGDDNDTQEWREAA